MNYQNKNNLAIPQLSLKELLVLAIYKIKGNAHRNEKEVGDAALLIKIIIEHVNNQLLRRKKKIPSYAIYFLKKYGIDYGKTQNIKQKQEKIPIGCNLIPRSINTIDVYKGLYLLNRVNNFQTNNGTKKQVLTFQLNKIFQEEITYILCGMMNSFNESQLDILFAEHVQKFQIRRGFKETYFQQADQLKTTIENAVKKLRNSSGEPINQKMLRIKIQTVPVFLSLDEFIVNKVESNLIKVSVFYFPPKQRSCFVYIMNQVANYDPFYKYYDIKQSTLYDNSQFEAKIDIEFLDSSYKNSKKIFAFQASLKQKKAIIHINQQLAKYDSSPILCFIQETGLFSVNNIGRVVAFEDQKLHEKMYSRYQETKLSKNRNHQRFYPYRKECLVYIIQRGFKKIKTCYKYSFLSNKKQFMKSLLSSLKQQNLQNIFKANNNKQVKIMHVEINPEINPDTLIKTIKLQLERQQGLENKIQTQIYFPLRDLQESLYEFNCDISGGNFSYVIYVESNHPHLISILRKIVKETNQQINFTQVSLEIKIKQGLMNEEKSSFQRFIYQRFCSIPKMQKQEIKYFEGSSAEIIKFIFPDFDQNVAVFTFFFLFMAKKKPFPILAAKSISSSQKAITAKKVDWESVNELVKYQNNKIELLELFIKSLMKYIEVNFILQLDELKKLKKSKGIQGQNFQIAHIMLPKNYENPSKEKYILETIEKFVENKGISQIIFPDFQKILTEGGIKEAQKMKMKMPQCISIFAIFPNTFNIDDLNSINYQQQFSVSTLNCEVGIIPLVEEGELQNILKFIRESLKMEVKCKSEKVFNKKQYNKSTKLEFPPDQDSRLKVIFVYFMLLMLNKRPFC